MKCVRKKWFFIASIVVISDQISKLLITKKMLYETVYSVTSFFNLLWINNYGTSFGFLSQQMGWQRWFLAGIAIVMIVYISKLLLKEEVLDCPMALGLSFILGGAVGNLIDRLYLGFVVDFIQLHYQDYYFAIFNLADTAITIGAILLIGHFFQKK